MPVGLVASLFAFLVSTETVNMCCSMCRLISMTQQPVCSDIKCKTSNVHEGSFCNTDCCYVTKKFRELNKFDVAALSVVVLFKGSWSRLEINGIFTRSCLGLGLGGLGIFDQDRSRPGQREEECSCSLPVATRPLHTERRLEMLRPRETRHENCCILNPH